jgi:hyperosmotically inducible periplasmic protein
VRTATGGRVGVKACAKAVIVGIMASAMLSGCAVAMLGGAARSGGGSGGSGGASAPAPASAKSTSGTSGGSASSAGRPASQPVSDSSISAAVRSRFSANSTLKALKIVVDTHDGIVTLKGPVNTLADKSAAQAEARAVSGVKGVNNQLTVR